jgi:hypothetical protein
MLLKNIFLRLGVSLINFIFNKVSDSFSFVGGFVSELCPDLKSVTLSTRRTFIYDSYSRYLMSFRESLGNEVKHDAFPESAHLIEIITLNAYL